MTSTGSELHPVTPSEPVSTRSMQPLLAAFISPWEPLVWFGLGVCGAVGIMAVLHPRRFITIALREPGWVESAGSSSGNEPASSSFYVLTACRLFGILLLGGIVTAAYLLGQR